MPHISKKKLDDKTSDQLEKYMLSILRDSGSKERVLVFQELLTKTERVMMAKRIVMLLLLKKGMSFYKISELIGVSPSTVSRFDCAVSRGKYRQTVKWVWKNSEEGAADVFLEALAKLAFTGRKQSFKKFVEEY